MMSGWRVWVAAGLSLGALAGCRQSTRALDDQDRSQPLVTKAEARRAEGDVDGAVRLYNEAIMADPGAARAHLDLALLLHDQKRDPVVAVYHYRRYLELRPDTEKRAMIEDRIRLATQLLAARNAETDQQATLRASDLEKENAALRLDIERLQRDISALRAALERATPTLTPVAAGDARGRGVHRTYRVKRGDTLAGIASQVYGDSGEWRRIFDANRDKISDKDNVPAGAVLVVP